MSIKVPRKLFFYASALVPTQQFLNLAAGIDIVHIGIEITLSIMAG